MSKKKDWIKDPEEQDRLLNRMFEGTSSKERLAEEFNCTPKAIDRQYECFIYTEDATKIGSYRPTKARVWRGGLRFTGLEKDLILKHRERHIGLGLTARILQRPKEDIEEHLHGLGERTARRHRLLEDTPFLEETEPSPNRRRMEHESDPWAPRLTPQERVETTRREAVRALTRWEIIQRLAQMNDEELKDLRRFLFD